MSLVCSYPASFQPASQPTLDVPNASQLQTLALFSARTVSGETIKGIAVSNYIEYEPPAYAWAGGPILENPKAPGIFAAHVAPDGTVSSVEIRKSTGYPEMDTRAEKWLKKWRFRPNSVTEVQMPISHFHYRYH